MALSDKLISSFLAFELDIDINSPIHNIRTSAIKRFKDLGFPNKKLENWKYTSLNQILKEDYTVFAKQKNVINFKKVKDYFIDNIESYKIVFVDGYFDPFLSQTSHEGIDICIMSAALNKTKYADIIKKYFNKISDEKNSLTSLNTAFSKEGVFLSLIHI